MLFWFPLRAEPTRGASEAFVLYTQAVESRLAEQHQSAGTYLADKGDRAQVHEGDIVIEQLTPGAGKAVDGSLLHDWRGTAFIAGATPADFERLIGDFGAYPRHFSPEVLRTSIVSRTPDHTAILMRVRQHHVITVVLDTAYDVSMGRTDARHGYSVSRSTHIAEIASPGSAGEHVVGPKDDHGFLQRLNSYWTYEQSDGGLYIQLEAVSLTRGIPNGLGWVVKPFIESIPRESLDFTLRSAVNALRRN